MSAINLTLTSDKQTSLLTSAHNIYTVAFDEGNNAFWTTIYTSGSGVGSSTATLPLINSGKLYVLETPASLNEIQAVITQESDISVANAISLTTPQFRFDSFEYALSPSDEGGSPQGNLTSVVGFGLPMSISVDYTNQPDATVGYNVSANTLKGQLATAGSPQFDFTSTSDFLYSGSPSIDTQGNYTKPTEFTAAHWTNYLTQLGSTLNDNPIKLAGIFNGAADANGDWHNQAFYSYVVTFDGTNFVLTPDEISQVKGIVKITSANLAANIYSVDATATAHIYAVVNDQEVLYEANAFVGANDQFGKLFTQLLTGLDLGYFGQTGLSPNQDALNTNSSVNINHAWNWSPIYAFGDNLVSGGAVTPTYDSYSEVFFNNTNSYGSQYSDNAMSQFAVGGPLINLFETIGGVNQNVAPSQITLTIFDDAETPTGYTQPELYDYIAPQGGSYSTFPTSVVWGETSVNFVLNLGIPAGTPNGGDANVGANRLSETSWYADPSKFALSYEYLTDSSNWSTPSFVYAESNDPNQLWSQWSLSAEGGVATITPNTGAGSEGVGNLLLNNIPISGAAGAVAWHRISVYDKTVANWQDHPLKSFNVYTTSDGTGGFYFQDGQLAVDGGAVFSVSNENSGVSSTLNLLVGAGTFIEPGLLEALAKPGVDFATSGTAPSAPVAGFLASSVFTAETGQDSLLTPTATAKVNNLAFAWTGQDSSTSSSTSDWVKYYTNKVSAQHTVKVSWSLFSQKDHGTNGSIETIADIDGKWVTDLARLTPGKYNVNMIEYEMVGEVPVQFALESSTLVLKVGGSPTLGPSPDNILAIRDAYLVTSTGIMISAANGTLFNDEGSPTTTSLKSTTTHGTLNFSTDGSFTYNPNSDFVGFDSFEYFAEKDIGGGSIEKSLSTVNLQVVPEIGLLAGSLDDYSTVGLAGFGYFDYGTIQGESDTYLALLNQYQNDGLNAQDAMYKLSKVMGETATAETLYPFLANPVASDDAINGFLDSVYSVLFDRAPDDVGRAYWLQDIKDAIGRSEDIDPYVFIIMNGAQTADMQILSAKSMIANEQIFQQYQHDDSISNIDSHAFLAATTSDIQNLLGMMQTVYTEAS